MSRIMRFFSHFIGCSLVFSKLTDDKLMNNIVNLIKTLASDTLSEIKSSYIQKDHLHPIFIQFGKDSYEDIGDPKVISSGQKNPVLLWEDTFLGMFKEKKDDNKKSNFNEKELLSKYQEKSLDFELISFE